MKQQSPPSNQSVMITSADLKKERVAVFGAGGFSGRHFERFVVTQNLEARYEFFGCTRDPAKAERSGSFSYWKGDVSCDGDAARFLAAVRPDYILNLVGIFRADSLEKFFNVNVGVSRAICDAVLSQELPVKKIVLVGSAAEYGASSRSPIREDMRCEPMSWYGLSKLYQTLLADYFHRIHGLPVVVARTFNILGEGLSEHLSIGTFMLQIRDLPDGGVVKVGDVTTGRDFLEIDEVSRRYWILLKKGKPGEIYNLCSGHPRTIRSVLERLIRQSGKRLSFEVDSSRFKRQDIQWIYGDSTKYNRLAR